MKAGILEAIKDLIATTSVATTSTKSPSALKSDIRQVLDRMQIRYRETRTGFDCIHMPSIDLSSFPVEQQTRHRKQGSSGSDERTSIISRRVTKRPSKLSFRVRGKDREKKEKEGGTTAEKEKDFPSRPSGATTLTATPSSESSSFFNVTSHNNPAADTNTRSETESTVITVQAPEDVPTPVPSSPPSVSKTLPPIPRDYAGSPTPQHAIYHTGEIDEDVFETIGANKLAVRFEINIVKVGISFGCVASRTS